MGKISPVSIKYIIYAKFEATGIVEKPDIIGAIFGQTEGLLGEDFELRDLQKNGKIGRIEVEAKTEESKTVGQIQIPTSLDKSETTIIAAAIETIERIGPCDSKVIIEKIEDVRGNKREFVITRAKELLAKMISPDSREIESAVSDSAKTAKIIEYGEEKLPAGPDVEISDELIVVEGRADVVNLLKYGIKNSIAMNGASLPKTISELGNTKKLILFIDGDRGGILIAKDALANAKIEAVSQAPAGKEVEELTGKEILACFRGKVSVDDFKKENFREIRGEERTYRKKTGRTYGRGRREEKHEEFVEEPVIERSESEIIEILRGKMQEIEGTKAALLLDANLNIIRKISASDLGYSIRRSRKKVFAIIYDGLVTNIMIRIAEEAGCKYFIAKNFAVSQETKINLLSL